MKIKQISEAIEAIAPLQLALDWDNVGLLIGNPATEIKTILVTIDITQDVLQEAKQKKADLILSYHPIIWDGLKKITTDRQAVVYELVRSGISVYSIHTAFDIATGGTNDLLAEILDLQETEPIGDFVPDPERLYKVIVFVPQKNVNSVAAAMFKAGAGAIGNYSHCSFRSEGTGTFKPLKGSNPTIGKTNKLESVNEIKLEAVVKANLTGEVIQAMRQAHPYETPAFDIVQHCHVDNQYGLGRIGKLAKPTSTTKLIDKIKKSTGAKAIGIVGPARRSVATAAVCAGSCGNIINTVISKNCDLYLTGELKHHHALAASEAGVTCFCLSHTVSERFALKNLVNRLKKRLKNVKISLSKKDNDPFTWKQV